MTARGRSFVRLLGDRLSKKGLYDSPGYWDMKAKAYEGLARSCWPSNTYNRHWDARQMRIIDRVLGDVRGLAIADVACGTGRASRHLAERGANVTGLDFAPLTLEAAAREAEARGVRVDFRLHDVLAPPAGDLVGRFDVVLTISCLAMACADARELERGLANVVSLVRPGGRILFLEPIHRSRLLRRILKMSAREWLDRCRTRGLELIDHGGMGFVPFRLALAFRDLPDAVVAPTFALGERLLDGVPALERLADYRWFLLRRTSAGDA